MLSCITPPSVVSCDLIAAYCIASAETNNITLRNLWCLADCRTANSIARIRDMPAVWNRAGGTDLHSESYLDVLVTLVSHPNLLNRRLQGYARRTEHQNWG